MKEQEETIEGAELDSLIEETLGDLLHFGIMLKGFRVQRGMTQRYLAKKLLIPVQNLYEIEKGKRSISLQKAIEFAEILQEPKQAYVAVWIKYQLRQAGYANAKVSVELEAA